MASVNKVFLIGNLGRDPESKYMPNGKAVANFSVATSEQWKDKNTGEKKEETEWNRITCYDKLAEIVGQYLRKGSKVYIEGKLKTRKWTDKDGIERYTTEIICNEMKMLDGKKDSNGGGFDSQVASPSTGIPPKPANGGGAAGFDDSSDIPFSRIPDYHG